MDVIAAPGPPVEWQSLLGYLNFSDGRPDVRFQQQLHAACQEVSQQPDRLAALAGILRAQLQVLHSGKSRAFTNTEQADAAIQLACSEFPPAYMDFHSNLLGHQSLNAVFTSFFLARVFEAILERRHRDSSSGHRAIVGDVIARLNDYVGYRPIPLLETRSALDIFPHEKVRPVPLYLRNAGVAAGPYQTLSLIHI